MVYIIKTDIDIDILAVVDLEEARIDSRTFRTLFQDNLKKEYYLLNYQDREITQTGIQEKLAKLIENVPTISEFIIVSFPVKYQKNWVLSEEMEHLIFFKIYLSKWERFHLYHTRCLDMIEIDRSYFKFQIRTAEEFKNFQKLIDQKNYIELLSNYWAKTTNEIHDPDTYFNDFND